MATIQFSDGSTTIDLTAGTGDYALMYNSWSPKVAKRRRSKMGGRSPYEDVQETMQIKVKGTSSSDCLANLTALSELFDQANAWGRGENVTAVECQFQATGSSTQVDAVIWDAEVIPPADFTWLGATSEFVIYPVTLQFVRRGLWLATDETETSSYSTGNPAVLTSSTFTDTASILWPYTVEIDCDATSGGLQVSEVYLLFQNAANKLYNVEAEGLSFSQAASTVVANSSAGSVARCQASTAATLGSRMTDSSPGFASGVKNIALYAVARNNSASTTDWTIQGVVQTDGTSLAGPKTIIEAGDNDRQVVNLGTFYMPADVTALYIDADGDVDGVNGTDDLDVDYICGVALDDSGHIIYISTEGAKSADSEIHIDHRLESDLSPLLWTSNSGGGTISDYPPYEGSITLLTSGSLISCLIFGVSSDGGDWTLQDTGNTEINFALSVTRTKSYLTPP